jgi:hypothetical protein
VWCAPPDIGIVSIPHTVRGAPDIFPASLQKWRSRRGGRMGERAGVVKAKVTVEMSDAALAVRQPTG